jgi:hypothetical protein
LGEATSSATVVAIAISSSVKTFLPICHASVGRNRKLELLNFTALHNDKSPVSALTFEPLAHPAIALVAILYLRKSPHLRPLRLFVTNPDFHPYKPTFVASVLPEGKNFFPSGKFTHFSLEKAAPQKMLPLPPEITQMKEQSEFHKSFFRLLTSVLFLGFNKLSTRTWASWKKKYLQNRRS